MTWKEQRLHICKQRLHMCMIELKKDLKETTFAYMQATFAYVYDRGNYKNDLKETTFAYLQATFAYLQATFAYRICKQRLHICMIEGTKKKTWKIQRLHWKWQQSDIIIVSSYLVMIVKSMCLCFSFQVSQVRIPPRLQGCCSYSPPTKIMFQ